MTNQELWHLLEDVKVFLSRDPETVTWLEHWKIQERVETAASAVFQTYGTAKWGDEEPEPPAAGTYSMEVTAVRPHPEPVTAEANLKTTDEADLEVAAQEDRVAAVEGTPLTEVFPHGMAVSHAPDGKIKVEDEWPPF